MIAFTRLTFGIAEQEFWELTPRLFYEMLEVHRLHAAHWESVIGQIPLMLYSANKKAEAPDMRLEDFMPSARREAIQPAPVQYATIGDLEAFLSRGRRAR